MSAYSHLLTYLLQPAYYSLRGRQYGAHLRFLNRSQWWPRDQLREFQWKELQVLLRAAFTSSPWYQHKFKQAGAELGDIRSWEDFSRLPTLTRDEIREHREELASKAYTGRLLTHATGGSSGAPTRFFITRESYDWRCAASVRAYSWTGYTLGEKALYLWGAPVGAQSKQAEWKMRVFRGLRREFMVSTFSQNDALWEQVLATARRIRPRYVVGYVSSLEGFSRWLLRTGQKVEGIRSVLAAAEPVFPATRSLVEEAIGAPLYNTYGSREFMSIGAECSERKGLHINMENILVETAAPARDGPSPILVTDLHNLGMPFIRYEIGDAGLLSERTCPCGRGLHLLETIEGRVLDVLRTPDGRIVPGEFFPHVLKDVPEVIEFQVEQKRLDHIVLYLVLAEELSANSKALLDSELRKWFGVSANIELRRVDNIPRRPSGKRRVTIGLETQ